MSPSSSRPIEISFKQTLALITQPIPLLWTLPSWLGREGEANVTKYTGSLTTSPWDHGISFYIFDRAIEIPTDQFNTLKNDGKRIFGTAAAPMDWPRTSFQRLEMELAQKL